MDGVQFIPKWNNLEEANYAMSDAATLPEKIWKKILSLLNPQSELPQASLVCRTWYRLSVDGYAWNVLKRELPHWSKVAKSNFINRPITLLRLNTFCKNRCNLSWQPLPLPEGFERVGEYRWAKIGWQDFLVGSLVTHPPTTSALCVWKIPSREMTSVWKIEEPFVSLRILPINDHQPLVIAAGDRSVYFWNLLTQEQTLLFGGVPNRTLSYVVAQPNKEWRLAISIGENKCIATIL
jgi:F-box-like